MTEHRLVLTLELFAGEARGAFQVVAIDQPARQQEPHDRPMLRDDTHEHVTQLVVVAVIHGLCHYRLCHCRVERHHDGEGTGAGSGSGLSTRSAASTSAVARWPVSRAS